MNLAASLLLSFTFLFVAANYLFVDSAFIKTKARFSLRHVQLIFASVITMVFIRQSINLVGVVTYLSLMIIYVFRISKKMTSKMPKEVSIKHTGDPYYYLALYWEHFARPALIIFFALVPAIILTYIFSKV